jgi:hypothetical protein
MSAVKSLLLFVLFFQVSSCKKAENRSCLKTAGNKITKIIPLPSFHKMELHQGMKIELIQDTADFLEIVSGENLVNFIDWTVTDAKLEVWNNNKCPYLRYKNGDVTLKIHFIALSALTYWGSELLTNVDAIHTNHLDVLMNDGAGDLSLNILANTINIQNPHGFANLFLKGSCSYLRLDFDGNGCFDTRNMLVDDSISVMYASNGKSFLSVDQLKIKAELSNSGDIWAYGVPSIIQKVRYSTGDLILK